MMNFASFTMEKDVYQFLHMKTNHIIYSQDVQWLGKLWHEFYCIPNMQSADKYIDPFDDYIEETSTEQEGEKIIQETEQMPAVIRDSHEDEHEEEDELIAMRTQSHNAEPVASRTRSQQDLTEMEGFANIKIGDHLHHQ